MIVVSDTSSLNGLAIIGYLSLLQQLYGQVFIPPAVAAELERGSQEDTRIAIALSLDWIEIYQPSNQPLIEELQNQYHLDLGESEAIALALELNVDELLIDERLGRREALRLGLSITGLLGILLVSKHRGWVSEIRPIIDRLINEANFRISEALYQEVLGTAGEKGI